MSNYANAFTQVYVILNRLDEEDFNRIPIEIVNAIRKNRNKEYLFEIDESLDLKDHNLLPETRGLLFKIYRDHLATLEQRQKILKMQNEERRKSELKKQEYYNKDVFADRNLKANQQAKQLILYKENIFKKIWNKIIEVLKK